MARAGSIATHAAGGGTVSNQDGAPIGTYIVRARRGARGAMVARTRVTIAGSIDEGVNTRDSRLRFPRGCARVPPSPV
jgi:hypothetical protein